MGEDDPDPPMTAEEVIAAADEIIENLRSSWRERGFPPEVLAHSMIGAGITEAREQAWCGRGVAGAARPCRRNRAGNSSKTQLIRPRREKWRSNPAAHGGGRSRERLKPGEMLWSGRRSAAFP
jgi:hypothetical protein